MSLTAGLHHLHLAKAEFLKSQDEDSEDWRGKLTVLETETAHVLDLARRYIEEMKKEGAKA